MGFLCLLGLHRWEQLIYWRKGRVYAESVYRHCKSCNKWQKTEYDWLTGVWFIDIDQPDNYKNLTKFT